ncbi:sulfotransferase [Plakobranchus ocellatus]|uniref:Sulfotransferase n=1 Tax=Plakobranchus ocellatus TaxID=259542 RepID=A0AAV4CT03_9GAST|nr:sulfotransferase [Plakobranchus ocellatus]
MCCSPPLWTRPSVESPDLGPGDLESRDLEPRDFYRCISQPGLLNHGVRSSHRSRPVENTMRASMLFNRLTDDYCYCKRIVPFYKSPVLLNTTKNPCWRDAKGRLECLPFFYIIGFSKSATTDLYFTLIYHPQITPSVKESHWFDYTRFLENKGSLQDYTDKFARATSYIETDLLVNGHSQRIFGDGTPCMAWFSLNWPCFQGNQDSILEPHYTNADFLHRLLPGAKLIVLVRDPAERLYSRYLTWKEKVPHPAYMNPSPQAFHELAARAVQLYQECFQTWSYRHCAYNGTIYTQASNAATATNDSSTHLTAKDSATHAATSDISTCEATTTSDSSTHVTASDSATPTPKATTIDSATPAATSDTATYEATAIRDSSTHVRAMVSATPAATSDTATYEATAISDSSTHVIAIDSATPAATSDSATPPTLSNSITPASA